MSMNKTGEPDLQRETCDIERGLLFDAIDKSLATIVFDLQGHVLRVNDNFARAMEYEVNELVGQHHRIFCSTEFANSQSYIDFWNDLRKGIAFQDKIERVTKTGRTLTLEATYMPIFNERVLVGVIKVATDITDREFVVKNGTSSLKTMVQKMTDSTDEVLIASQTVADEMNNLNTGTNSVNESVQHISSVVSFVSDIANQSKILGLNASIEAARSGEHGRGFSVVADEIRKMAERSQQSAKEIEDLLKSISSAIHAISEQSTSVTRKVNNNLQTIGELRQAYENIVDTTERLAEKL